MGFFFCLGRFVFGATLAAAAVLSILYAQEEYAPAINRMLKLAGQPEGANNKLAGVG